MAIEIKSPTPHKIRARNMKHKALASRYFRLWGRH